MHSLGVLTLKPRCKLTSGLRITGNLCVLCVGSVLGSADCDWTCLKLTEKNSVTGKRWAARWFHKERWLTERYSVTENCWAVRRFRKELWLIHLLKSTLSLKNHCTVWCFYKKWWPIHTSNLLESMASLETAVLFDVFTRNGDWSTPATYWKVLCHWKPLCCLTFSQGVVTDPHLKLIERCHWYRRFHKELWLIHTCNLLKNRVSVETAVVFDMFRWPIQAV